MADFLNTVPQVSVASSPDGYRGSVAGSFQGVQLHGLPMGTTLVLIDGQAVELNYYGTIDLSMIPAAAVDRIDILPVGSSAIYGSDAIAGVVNLITKKSFDGLSLNAKYNFADEMHNTTLGAAWGKDWGRGSLSLMVSHQQQSPLQGADRNLPPGWRQFHQFRRS